MAKTKQPKRPAGDLTTVEIQTITDEVVDLRKKILATGITVLNRTPEWDTLRKEIESLNKVLNADAKAKTKASQVPVDDAPS